MATIQVDAFEAPLRDSATPLAAQIVAMVQRKIGLLALRPGSRMPSIRRMAAHLQVSPFTVVQAYEQLGAQGLLQARRGAGYYVCGRAAPQDTGALATKAPQAGVALAQPAPAWPPLNQTWPSMNIGWLLRNILNEMEGAALPGSSALLPKSWLDAKMVADATRSVGRVAHASLLGYGALRGYLPLRQAIAQQLGMLGVPTDPAHNLVLTSGVTHAVDLVLRALTKPGDTVLVEDPAWFLVFGRLAAAGVHVVGVPRTPSGPDLEALERLAVAHRPRLLLLNSVVHNPTGWSLSARSAHAVLKLAQAHDFYVLEDDTYADLHPGGAIRLAALDGLERVLLTSGYSKTLAAGLRVGWLAGAPALIEQVTDLKLLSGLTTPELPERVVHTLLHSGQHARHLQRMRLRVDSARVQLLAFLAEIGFATAPDPAAGMFVWLNTHEDSEQLARRAAQQGMLLAPGRLFSPAQTASTHVRLSVAVTDDARTLALLRQLLLRH